MLIKKLITLQTKYKNCHDKIQKFQCPCLHRNIQQNNIETPTENIYEALSIIAKRSNQINLDIRKELHEKLDEFATHNDSLGRNFRKQRAN